jgi:hypothetical protein
MTEPLTDTEIVNLGIVSRTRPTVGKLWSLYQEQCQRMLDVKVELDRVIHILEDHGLVDVASIGWTYD